MRIGEKLTKWRRAQDLTQREAAKRAGISQAAWSAIETGNVKRLGLDVARRIVAVTNGAVTLDELARATTRPAAARRTGTDG